jgi:hypothetical protein
LDGGVNRHRLFWCTDRARWSLTAHSGRAGDAGTVRIANVHAGAENCTVVNLASFQNICQRQIYGFHRFFQVFFGFSGKSAKNGSFLKIFGN